MTCKKNNSAMSCRARRCLVNMLCYCKFLIFNLPVCSHKRGESTLRVSYHGHVLRIIKVELKVCFFFNPDSWQENKADRHAPHRPIWREVLGLRYAPPPLSTTNLASSCFHQTAASSRSEQLRRWNKLKHGCKGPSQTREKLTERLFSIHSRRLPPRQWPIWPVQDATDRKRKIWGYSAWGQIEGGRLVDS
jgi:hypothetical protein